MTGPTNLVAPDDARVEAVSTVLAPYPWRDFTPEKVALLALGALDQYAVRALLESLSESQRSCGDPFAGHSPDAGPALVEAQERRDERVDVLVESISSCLWRQLTLTAVCRHMVGELQRWRWRRQRLDEELARTLG